VTVSSMQPLGLSDDRSTTLCNSFVCGDSEMDELMLSSHKMMRNIAKQVLEGENQGKWYHVCLHRHVSLFSIFNQGVGCSTMLIPQGTSSRWSHDSGVPIRSCSLVQPRSRRRARSPKAWESFEARRKSLHQKVAYNLARCLHIAQT
jgi:hypothetical protein